MSNVDLFGICFGGLTHLYIQAYFSAKISDDLTFKGLIKNLGVGRFGFFNEAAYALMLACPTNVALICNYGHTIKMLAKRTQSKLGPHIKRQICKRCHLILRPGVTSDVKLKSKPMKHIQVTCKFCDTKKRFPSKPNYELYFDKLRKNIKVL